MTERAKKTSGKETAGKETGAKETGAKKTGAKKTGAKKTAAKKTAAKKRSGTPARPENVASLATERERALTRAAEALRGGRLVVAPTDTIYGLLADAFKPWAIAHVFALKQRPRSLPLPILVSRPKQAWALCGEVTETALHLAAAFWPGPLTLVMPENPELEWDLGQRSGTIALRMPAHDDLVELIARVGPVAGTSANLSGQPTPRTVLGVRKMLGDAVDVYLDGGRSRMEAGSTIVDCTEEEPRILRVGPIGAEEIAAAARGWPQAETSVSSSA